MRATGTARFLVATRKGLATRALVLLVGALALLGFGGCGQGRNETNSAVPVPSEPAKSGFIAAADRVCSRHLDTVLAWLEKPRVGNVWQQTSTQNEGIYRIIAATIGRLEGLGPPPDPTADAFADYLKTLKARAVLYRLTSIADQRHDRAFAARLQERVVQIDTVGDRDAHRYGLLICGASPRDIAPPLEPDGTVRD